MQIHPRGRCTPASLTDFALIGIFGLNFAAEIHIMAMATLACALLVSSAPVTVKSLPLDKVPNLAGFAVYRPDSIPVGYTLVRANLYTWETKTLLKLTYTNRKALTQMDIIQSPSTKATHGQNIKSLLSAGKVDLDIAPEMTFVTGRKSSTDLGLAGTLITAPSADKVLQSVVLWKPSQN